jgi:hypothetical protein
MFRVLTLTFCLAWAGQAFSAVMYEGFTYAADSRFSLSLRVDGQPVVLNGSMRYGDKVTVTQGLVSAELKSYRQESSVVSVIVAIDGQDMASLFLIDDSNNLHLLNKNPILERRASMAGTLEKIIAKLKDPKFKGWSTAQTFAWLKDMSDKTPEKQLFQYYDKLELGPVTLPKPGAPGVTSQGPQTSNGPGGMRSPEAPGAARPSQISPGQDEGSQGLSPEERRRRAWEQSRRAQWERQHRRGQDGRYMPPPYGYSNGYPPPPPVPNGYGGGYGYPPPPPGNYPPPGYGRQPYGYAPPPPPPPQQRGGFQNIFGE